MCLHRLGWRAQQEEHVEAEAKNQKGPEGSRKSFKNALSQEQASPRCSHCLSTLPLCPFKKFRGRGRVGLTLGNKAIKETNWRIRMNYLGKFS